MALRSCVTTFAAFLVAMTNPGNGWAASNIQSITVKQDLQVPGAILNPGEYTFSVEDRLQDRAIVRIAARQNDKYYFLLSTPSAKLRTAPGSGLILFRSGSNKRQILRGWMCPGCSVALELAYPKAEAAKVTNECGQSVLAVDPEYDKLPLNLTPDDMKIVTLWLLSPKRIAADNHGKGVTAVKYDSTIAGKPASAPQMVAESQGSPTEAPRFEHMPKTATNTFALGIWGLLLMSAAAGSWASRRWHAAGRR